MEPPPGELRFPEPRGAAAPGPPGQIAPVPPEAFAPTPRPPPSARTGSGDGRTGSRAQRLTGIAVSPCAANAGDYISQLFRGGARRGLAQGTMGTVVPAPRLGHAAGPSPGELKTTKMAAGRARGRGTGAPGGHTALASGRWGTRGIAEASAESVPPPASPLPRTLGYASGPQRLVGQPQNGGERQRQREQQ